VTANTVVFIVAGSPHLGNQLFSHSAAGQTDVQGGFSPDLGQQHPGVCTPDTDAGARKRASVFDGPVCPRVHLSPEAVDTSGVAALSHSTFFLHVTHRIFAGAFFVSLFSSFLKFD